MSKNRSSAETISTLEKLFEDHFSSKPDKIDLLPVSGSDRRYYRLSNKKNTAIGTFNNNVAENNSYFYFTELFKKAQINVPEVYGIGKDRRTYLQQDLGNTTLFHMLMQDGHTKEVREYFHKSLEQLAKAQWIAGRECNFDQCFATKQFDEKAIMADLLYFKYYFADLQRIPYNKQDVVKEMEMMSKELGRMQPQMLMYRDFQSRNIMIHDGKTYLIDYQGSMQGPPQYDIASLLWQAKAQLPEAWKEDLINGYVSTINSLPIPRMDEVHFRRGYAQFVLLRLLQVLGAYGFRGLLEHKPHFLSSIGPALKNVATFLADNPQLQSYPELRKLLEQLCTKEMQAKYETQKREQNANLLVQIASFSYKSGVPKDKSGHGGGFVFDCRGILNPGRYKAYKHLTGHDEDVQEFLKNDTRMLEFLEHVKSIVSISVDDYIARGFDHLSVAFGCTGGQHRSVFSAEQLAAHLSNEYNIPVTVSHLNEKNWRLDPETDNTVQ